VPADFLDARGAWKKQNRLRSRRRRSGRAVAKNFERFDVPDRVRAAGPKAQKYRR